MALTQPSKATAFDIIVSSLPGLPDVTLLRAAAQAGALAVLNLEALEDRQVEEALLALTRGKSGRLGVRLAEARALDVIPAHALDALDAVVVAPTVEDPGAVVARLREAPRTILFECTSSGESRLALDLGVDGLIAKGHEAGGRVGEETTFVLLQRLIADAGLPVWAHGGVATHTVAGCVMAGAVGAVLDSQALLLRESTAPDQVKRVLARFGGDETTCLGAGLNDRYRVYRRPGLAAVDELRAMEDDLERGGATRDAVARWRAAVAARVNWGPTGAPLWPLGQDAAFAVELAERYRSIAGVIAGLQESVASNLASARALRPLDRQSPLAQAHGTEYPILQGPMTRVSDVAAFAAAVAEGGALPFLALALLRAPELRNLFRETRDLLGDRPWGVGILGFVPLELRQEQLAVLQEFSPKFALIAGGRPDQAEMLERQGITTYLHVPAPSLLKIFLDQGARHFVFEGRECGGHVGPRTSFVLWQSVVTTLLGAIDKGVPAEALHAVFAGGIHDARSAAIVAAIAAPLAQRGVKVGVLIGTAYLYTDEAVASGAIVETFQREAVACDQTVLLESGPGHATRCADTTFAHAFKERRRELLAAGKHPDEIRMDLESLNLGRLRIASKGVRRGAQKDAGGPPLEVVSIADQRRDGMFMIGQVAALRHGTCRIAELHADISLEGTRLLRGKKTRAAREGKSTPANALSSEVAIIGMGCLLPKAHDIRTLWNNLLEKKDAITEIPKDRFDADRYYDPDRRARDKIYSRSGGFLEEVPFDPLKHGMPPASVPSIDPFQLLTLEVVNQALRDAGYADRPFDRERTSVILGASGGVGDLGFRYGIRAGLPMFFDTVSEDVLSRLPEWTEDSFAGVLLNVAAGRVANRLDLGGLNFTVDAACASSLAAIFIAARELESGSSEMVIVGGIDTVNSPFGYLCFGSAQALSPSGRCRTFDEGADGIAISEGLSVLVLKRLADAERAGDRIYAVIRAVAGSSDGKGKGLTAPRPEGQARVLERAYAAAGVSPSSVSLIEAHGTGTIAGDGAEVSALSRVFTGAGASPQTCAIGSIKSMIGHTKSAAGVTGVLKVAMALHHKILPPTLNVTMPNAKLRDPNTPFYVNSEARPWVALGPGEPRRAGVSSFGFGGTNFHVVLEEYDRQPSGVLPATAPVDDWPAELAVWNAQSPERLIAALERFEGVLPSLDTAPLRSVAAAICRQDGVAAGPLRLAIVATSIHGLRENVRVAREALAQGTRRLSDPRGVFLGEVSAAATTVAFLYPGQGSQFCNMHRELSLAFSEVRQSLEVADEITAGRFSRPLSTHVYPPPTFTKADEERGQLQLTDTSVAQPALGAVEVGLTELLARFGVRPQYAAGHSYGEYVALWSAGVFNTKTLFTLSAERGRVMKAATAENPGTMAAVSAPPDAVTAVLAGRPDVWVANLNAPRQTVIAGTVAAVEEAVGALVAAGLSARRIPVACAFHSPLVEPSRLEFSQALGRAEMRPPRIPVFSNTLGGEYTGGVSEIRQVLAEHVVRPVRFVEQVQAMHDRGARVFLEVGPRGVLSSLARESLAGRDALVLPMDAADKRGLVQLLFVLGQLVAAGVPVDHDTCFRGRTIEPLRLDRVTPRAAGPAPHVWMVTGGRARPLTPKKAVDAPARAAEVVGARLPSAASTAAATPAAAPALRSAPAEGHNAQARAVTPAAPMASAAPRAARPSQNQAPSPAVAATAASRPHINRSSNGVPMDQSQPPTLVRGDHDVIRQFQQLMGQFLQTQALVMTAYLQGNARALPAEMLASAPLMPAQPSPVSLMQAPIAPPFATPPPQAAVAPPPVAVQEARSAAPVAVSAPVAATGDSAIGRVDVKVSSAEKAAVNHGVNGTGHNGTAVGRGAQPMTLADVLKEVIRIVADRTGYPEDMLDVDSNIEADLGIDSIKRMEILTAFQELHGGAAASSLQGSLERLTAQKTLRDTATLLTGLLAPETATVS